MAACSGEVVYQKQASRSLQELPIVGGAEFNAEAEQTKTMPDQIEDCAAFDNEALIRSYDRAVHSFQETLGEGKSPVECKSSSESESEVKQEEEEEGSRQWWIGDSCLAVWSGDGLLYPACITAVDQDQGCCTVRFDGYGNEEAQLLTALLPPGWRPAEDEDAVREEELSDTLRFPEGESDKDNHQANSRIPQPQKDEKPPLPPPPHNCDDEEALLSMLLAWHLSGYHTGYYMGLRRGRQESAVAAPKKRPPQHPQVSEHR